MEDRDELIQLYFNAGLQQREILAHLAISHNIIISERTLKRILKGRRLFRRKSYSNIALVASFIERQVQTSSQLHGYRWMHLKCLQYGFVVTQETVRQLLHRIDPVGIRFRRKQRLRRRQYRTKGPNFLWHFDSYDKLKPYGICINGCIDGFSRHIIWLEVNSTSSDPRVIAGYFVKSVARLGGCPRLLRSDMGTENGHVEQMQIYLRRNPTNDRDTTYTTPFLYGTSPHNQRIEAWWGILRKHNSQFWMNLFSKLKDDGFFRGDALDKALIQFCFMKLIADELNTILVEWNSHRIRRQKNSLAPAGRPINMYTVPELYNTSDYLCRLSDYDIAACYEECVFNEYPCDEDVHEICCLIMEERGISQDINDPYDAVNLYMILREEILSLL